MEVDVEESEEYKEARSVLDSVKLEGWCKHTCATSVHSIIQDFLKMLIRK